MSNGFMRTMGMSAAPGSASFRAKGHDGRDTPAEESITTLGSRSCLPLSFWEGVIALVNLPMPAMSTDCLGASATASPNRPLSFSSGDGGSASEKPDAHQTAASAPPQALLMSVLEVTSPIKSSRLESSVGRTSLALASLRTKATTVYAGTVSFAVVIRWRKSSDTTSLPVCPVAPATKILRGAENARLPLKHACARKSTNSIVEAFVCCGSLALATKPLTDDAQ
mmetsp:Transcript_37367/g.75746  ORF Transcript_37367/g.75746 Transcript_37367/m.75746 type:complete len:225 (-) Transcript_37367:12-686(-)